MKKLLRSILIFSGVIINITVLQANITNGIGVMGTHLTKDGHVWIPKGANLGAFTYAPYFTNNNIDVGSNGGFIGASKSFGPEMLKTAKSWNIDSLRFLVSQTALDPQSRLYSKKYLEALTNGVNLCLKEGFSVMISMQDEKHTGENDPKPLPTQETVRAWNVIGPIYANHPYVMYEIFNESSSPVLKDIINYPNGEIPAEGKENWELWLNGGVFGQSYIGHQKIIDNFRSRGWNNLLIVDGLHYAGFLGQQVLRINDPINCLAFGVHPYFHNFCNSPQKWDAAFGNISKVAPVLITEWFQNSTDPFHADSYQLPIWCAEFLSYIKQHKIPLWVFALDIPTTIVLDHDGKPNNWVGFNPNPGGIKLGEPGAGCGKMVKEFFLNPGN
jgi:Cellulase (glycosyl hydrolase family 5)